MDTLPVELLERIALYAGWSGYRALRATQRRMWQALTWKRVTSTAVVRECIIATLPWSPNWFLQHADVGWTVRGVWMLDGFHGSILFWDPASQTMMGSGRCEAGLLEGLVVLRNAWRGGVMLLEMFTKGHPHRATRETAR